jgi:hypothetical protein
VREIKHNLLLAVMALSVAGCGATNGSPATSRSATVYAASEASAGSNVEAPPLMQRLQQARAFDLSQSSAFTRSAPSLDHYYSRKVDEVTDVMRRVRAGQDVPPDDIQHALDNSLASTFGVPVQ